MNLRQFKTNHVQAIYVVVFQYTGSVNVFNTYVLWKQKEEWKKKVKRRNTLTIKVKMTTLVSHDVSNN